MVLVNTSKRANKYNKNSFRPQKNISGLTDALKYV
jgi:hypothetical protein